MIKLKINEWVQVKIKSVEFKQQNCSQNFLKLGLLGEKSNTFVITLLFWVLFESLSSKNEFEFWISSIDTTELGEKTF